VKNLKNFFQCKNLPLLFLFLIFISCFLNFSCGYHFRPVGRPIGVSLDSIAIPLFSSTSSLIGFEGEFTRVVREEFMTNSRVRIESKDKAQAVLSGRIYSITTEPLTYTVTQQAIHNYLSTDEVTKSRTLKVRLDVKLTDTATGKIIWQDSTITGKASFLVSADPLTNRYNQLRASISIAQDLATKIYARTMERF
jgi:hypothetical protein